MKYPSAQKIVDYLVKNYRRAGKMMAKAGKSWMSQSSFDDTADRIEAAYEAGNVENVDENRLSQLFAKYGSSDIYHLAASYFNSTGKILSPAGA